MRIRRDQKLLKKIWRTENKDKWRDQKKRNYGRGAVNLTNSREPWTAEIEREIMAKNRPTDRVLAEKLGRSVEAIQVKRSKIKYLQNDLNLSVSSH